jgi:hypothetical protein
VDTLAWDMASGICREAVYLATCWRTLGLGLCHSSNAVSGMDSGFRSYLTLTAPLPPSSFATIFFLVVFGGQDLP